MRAAEHPLLVIAGGIGTGKTTLAGVLRDRFGIPAWIERPELNPHLAGLYEDPARWAFAAQEVFLEHALQRLREAGRAAAPAVVDRSPHETVDVFGRMLTEMGFLTPEQLQRLRRRLETACARLAAPSLMIYLHAPVDELLARVRARGWDEERPLTASYLSTLQAQYGRFSRDWTASPVLDVDSATVDLRDVHNVERLLAPTALLATLSHGDPRQERP